MVSWLRKVASLLPRLDQIFVQNSFPHSCETDQTPWFLLSFIWKLRSFLKLSTVPSFDVLSGYKQFTASFLKGRENQVSEPRRQGGIYLQEQITAGTAHPTFTALSWLKSVMSSLPQGVGMKHHPGRQGRTTGVLLRDCLPRDLTIDVICLNM